MKSKGLVIASLDLLGASVSFEWCNRPGKFPLAEAAKLGPRRFRVSFWRFDIRLSYMSPFYY